LAAAVYRTASREQVSLGGLKIMSKLLVLAALFWVAVGCRVEATASDFQTDANIVTGIDISDSVSAEDLDRLIAALASAISSRSVVESIRNGTEGRIGFSLFAWHHYRYRYVDWMLVSSADDANEVASMIRKRILLNAEPNVVDIGMRFPGSRTDISRAIDYAARSLDRAPYPTHRRIANIVGNGVDNVGEAARPARDRFMQEGGTINGVVFGDDPLVSSYYRDEVAGGPGAFVATLASTEDLVDAFRRKFLSDIALSRN